MGERTHQIEQEIAESRSELSQNFDALEGKLKSYVDWRAQFHSHPAAMLALAFGGGAVLAALFPPRVASLRQRKRYRRRLDDFRSPESNGATYATSTEPDAPESTASDSYASHADLADDLDGKEDYAGSPSRRLFPSGNGSHPRPNETRQHLNAFASALVGVGVSRLARFVDSLLPGFDEEFQKAKTPRGPHSARGSRFSAGDYYRADVAAGDPAGPTN